MAFPNTIVTATVSHGNNKPHVVGGNYYYIVEDTGTNGDIRCYKASDPGGTWTEQNSSNRPHSTLDSVLARQCLSSCNDGTLIHVAQMFYDSNSSQWRLFYQSFDTSTDTWNGTTAYETVEAIATDNVDLEVIAAWCDINIRPSTSNPIICYTGDCDAVMGGAKMRVDYSERVSGTWGSPTSLDTAGDVHYGQPVAAQGTGGSIHFLILRETDTTDPPNTFTAVNPCTLESDDTVYNTFQLTTAVPDGHLRGLSNAVSWHDGTRQYIGCLVQSSNTAGNDLSFISVGESASRVSASYTNEYTDILGAESSVRVLNDHAKMSLIYRSDKDTLYCMYGKGSDADAYLIQSSDDGANWSTPVKTFAALANDIGATSYYRTWNGSYNLIIGYVVEDNGVIKWDEYTLEWGPNPFFTRERTDPKLTM